MITRMVQIRRSARLSKRVNIGVIGAILVGGLLELTARIMNHTWPDLAVQFISLAGFFVTGVAILVFVVLAGANRFSTITISIGVFFVILAQVNRVLTDVPTGTGGYLLERDSALYDNSTIIYESLFPVAMLLGFFGLILQLNSSRRELKEEVDQNRGVNRSLQNALQDNSKLLDKLSTANEELKKAAEKALKSAKSADQSSKAKSEFLSNMSHEIRTPMNGVSGMTTMLLDTGLTEKQRDYVNTIKSSADSLLDIVNEILDLSKIETGDLQLESVPFDIAEIVLNAVDLFTPRADEKGIIVKTKLDPSLPQKVFGDPGRIRQIVVNLVGNAVKFTDKGGVKVSVTPVRLNHESLTIRLTVRDTGIGIPDDRLGLIFDSFSQGDNSTSRKYGGTGLGLAISRRLAGAMGGTIDVKSKVDSGSTFVLNLTLGVAEGIRTPTDFYPQGNGIEKRNGEETDRPLKILLAEDNITNQKVTVAFLEKLGYQSDVALDGLETLRMLKENEYDLILMDIQMPNMDGYEAVKIIRDSKSDVPNHEIPIVALTANAMKIDQIHCIEAGMNDYLSKPLQIHALETAILRWTSEN
jgi:signal transduction histidine kinase/CheY-like chemotaxis protein